MSFKSIIQDMKGEIGSISKKGFDVKMGYGLRSRSHRVVQDSVGPVVIDGLKQSCWVNMPPELLRDVLVRLEAAESTWPARKHVVACAGVCRNWREITKEIVKSPELSGKLTFPISVKQPGPRGDSLLQCFIKRNRNTQTYHLYLGLTQALTDNGKFLLAARKCRRPTCTDYIISLDADDMSKWSSTYIGKLRSNFLGTKFTVYDAQPPHAGAMAKSRSTRLVALKQVSPRVPAGNYPVAHITYELNVLGSRGPRRMQCTMNSIPASAIEPGGVAPTQTEFLLGGLDSYPSISFFRSKSSRSDSFKSGPLPSQKEGILVLKNKAPRWHEQLQCWCLNFRGRVTVASVKNFQLVASPENGQASQEHEKVLLQFGKVGKDLFTMDFRYPISAFQAFAICLSSFDTKIACE
ncbi:tubby-like F-box protein 3 [Tasmannia lanceolata]|uniref:tubby-like F-box protein 3 n=1 Tax=Tasmannia lanceolata TaxID=3420 RepID=UPI004062A3B3